MHIVAIFIVPLSCLLSCDKRSAILYCTCILYPVKHTPHHQSIIEKRWGLPIQILQAMQSFSLRNSFPKKYKILWTCIGSLSSEITNNYVYMDVYN